MDKVKFLIIATAVGVGSFSIPYIITTIIVVVVAVVVGGPRDTMGEAG